MCAAWTLSSCGAAPVEVQDTSASGDAAVQCRTLITSLPDRVDGAEARPITPDEALAAAWGDPPIVLRCGVSTPPALTASSACFGVDGVGWLATQGGREVHLSRPLEGSLTFTTIGRSAYVEVTVPAGYQPQADALVDLASDIAAATTEVQPCR